MTHAMIPSLCLLVALALPVSAFGAHVPSVIEQNPANEHTNPGKAQREHTFYDSWLVSLRAALDATNEDPVHAPALALELNKVSTFTESLGADVTGRHLRDEGLLTLARAYLVTDESPQAALTMDEAIRSAGGYLDARRYGPSLATLYFERLAAITDAGGAVIKVNCRTPCRVLLNERPAATDSRHLPSGPYRVHIIATDGNHPPQDLSVLTLTGKTQQITFPAPAPAASDGSMPTTSKQSKRSSSIRPPNFVGIKRRRNLPRWLEVAAMIGGAAAVGAGTFLVLSEGHCTGDRPTVPTVGNPGQCSSIYAARYPGFALIAAGSTLVAGGAVTLSIDEFQLRTDRQTAPQSPKRRLMLGYRRAF